GHRVGDAQPPDEPRLHTGGVPFPGFTFLYPRATERPEEGGDGRGSTGEPRHLYPSDPDLRA
ncbi:hypothetical protein ACFQE1_08985, partial [Halobium palmae]